MALERVELFKYKEFLSFLLISLFILSYSLLIEYQNYKKLTRFNSAIVEVKVLKQYEKTKNSRTYQVLKLKTDDSLIFYTGARKSFEDVLHKRLTLEIYAKEVSFYNYLTTFYAYSKVQTIHEEVTLKQKLNSAVAEQHQDPDIANIYQALFSATPLNYSLIKSFSNLGVSHLLAISGFHLGVLSAILFFLVKPLYSFAQDRYFPYRNAKADIFVFVAFVLLLYLNFLDSPASLLRAFVMLVIGFALYDRGIKIVSMQTLLLTIILILVFSPRLFFSLGFWLSVSGVFFIFLFLIHFKHLHKVWQFLLIPIFVYITMLPLSLVIFSNFSIYHPLSILWTSLFTIFYPLSIVLHIVGFGGLLDPALVSLISLGNSEQSVEIGYIWLVFYALISLISVFYKNFIWLTFFVSISFFIYAIYHIT
ncbi:MAG: ComEC/Rec2 family competence protein [Sulfurimonas sp.]|uniref:ComEC/Rec2 family competence protein n=1 Tax=Sulfurimonas sp. TaxID=2022749 RepID=UPI0025E0311D|nr:ComEC/Rec2 family competence protein [Sulfurimonas sp.]MCK9491298.1 ComEC/Rec2 family competence protein [Sulfurimonas sp.]